MSAKTAIATPEKTIREQIIDLLVEFARDPDGYDVEEITDWAIDLIEQRQHRLTQKVAEAVVKKTIQTVGDWLANRPPIFGQGIHYKRIKVSDIAIMKIKGELPNV